MNSRDLFTKESLSALEHGAETRISTTFNVRKTWLFLTATTLLAGALTYWGFFGAMVESVSGAGIALRGSGISAVTAPSSGLLSDVSVSEGEPVVRGQIVGQILNLSNLFNVKKTELDHDRLLEQTRLLEAGTTELSAMKHSVSAQKQETLKTLRAAQEKSRSRGEEISQAYDELRSAGAASKTDYYSALDRTVQTDATLGSLVMQAFDEEVAQKDADWNHRQTLLELQQRLDSKAEEMSIAQKHFYESTWARARGNGIVTEVLKREGSYVSEGERIALVSDSTGTADRVVAYIPLGEGKKIRPGMSVFFSPVSMPASEYGSIKGVVRAVSRFAVSVNSIAEELQNDTLSRSLSGNTAVLRVDVELLPDRHTPSGLKWTSRNGAPSRLENGSIGVVSVNTEYRFPASYIIPALREKLFGKNPETPAAN